MKRTVLLALLGLAACADPHETLSPDFGNAVQTNIDAQVVNPRPALGRANTDGQRIGNAIHRYQTNTVFPPQGGTGATSGSTSTSAPAAAP